MGVRYTIVATNQCLNLVNLPKEGVTLDLVGNDFSAVMNDFGIPDGRECIPDGQE